MIAIRSAMSALLRSQWRAQRSMPASRAYNDKARVGNRDYVGYGINGGANYKDCSDFPFPAVRWRENTPDVLALREKEKGDWTLLTIEEKRCLYRASFCQTFSEFMHPTGQWKFVLGWTLIIVSFALWMRMFVHLYVEEPLPDSFSEESQRAQLRRMLDLRVGPVDGLSSKWDYKEDRWK